MKWALQGGVQMFFLWHKVFVSVFLSVHSLIFSPSVKMKAVEHF